MSCSFFFLFFCSQSQQDDTFWVETLSLGNFINGHNSCFLEFLSKNYSIHLSILDTNKNIWKTKGPQWTTFKSDTTKVPSFFLIFYSLVLKIEICLKYFLGKKYQKQPFCGAVKGAMNETQPEKKWCTQVYTLSKQKSDT